jgi:hypothetical protein
MPKREGETATRRRDVIIVNPLGAALSHYSASLEELLVACGAKANTISLMEPSASGQRRARWVVDYVNTLRGVARKNTGARVIVAWPVLGYWDLAIARYTLGQIDAQIVFHDPEPLNRAVGYGRIARRVGMMSCVAAPVVVHSRVAAEALNRQASLPVIELPLPMFPPEIRRTHRTSKTVIRVLGQYKPDRDIQALVRLAAEGPEDWCYEIVGRGWPDVRGWQVRSEFVSEEEFDALIRSSRAVLIPYRRFFQSEVALRCIELGTPIVGPSGSSLQALLGARSAWLVTNEQWLRSTVAAAQASDAEVRSIASAAYEQVRIAWTSWLWRSVPRASTAAAIR